MVSGAVSSYPTAVIEVTHHSIPSTRESVDWRPATKKYSQVCFGASWILDGARYAGVLEGHDEAGRTGPESHSGEPRKDDLDKEHAP